MRLQLALSLILPEFATECISISYMFEKDNLRCPIALFGYIIPVAVFAIIFLFMGFFLMLTSIISNEALLVILLLTSLTAILIQHVQVLSFGLLSLPYIIILVLGAYYLHLGFLFIPGLSALIISVAVFEYVIVNCFMTNVPSKD